MLIQEMHISIQQDLQKVNSAVFDYFLPEEIDLILNKQQIRFIRNQFSSNPVPGDNGYFENSLASVSDLASLIKKQTILVNDNTALLPPDFYYYLQSESKVVKCISKNPNVGRKEILVSMIDLSMSLKDVISSEESIVINNEGIKIEKSYPSMNIWDFIEILKNDLNKELNQYNIYVYWEKAGIVNKRNSLIFVDYNKTTKFQINNYPSDQLIFVNNYVIIPDDSVITTSSNRLIRNERILDVMADSFKRGTAKSPALTLTDNFLNVHKKEDKSYIVKEIMLTYIRKPLPMSLSLSYNCELPEIVHQKICDMTTDYIKLITQSPDWQSKKQDTLNNA